jgi:hypothetical protein
MTIIVYTFERKGEGKGGFGFTTQDYQEAECYARENRLLLIENEFEWADSGLVRDFSEEGEEE